MTQQEDDKEFDLEITLAEINKSLKEINFEEPTTKQKHATPSKSRFQGVRNFFTHITGGGTEEKTIANSLKDEGTRDKITTYAQEYLTNIKNELANEENKEARKSGVKPTEDVVKNTMQSMQNLGGDPKAFSSLEKQAADLTKAIKDDPNSSQDPKFNRDYANFCAASHDQVAAYHGAQQKYFQSLAANDPDPGRKQFWNQCSQTAGQLQAISRNDAAINRSIGERFGKEISQVQSTSQNLQGSLTNPKTTTTPQPVKAAPQLEPAKPQLQRTESTSRKL